MERDKSKQRFSRKSAQRQQPKRVGYLTRNGIFQVALHWSENGSQIALEEWFSTVISSMHGRGQMNALHWGETQRL
ncbi:hypothetical protein Taro_023424 [Colocasia esculenta]|uniref:Uncharacterized protein n=1 Tax=Colocasia esculenta TaxID=4460 RepID=A0A843V6E4_COLES|nr:hypothetical protein [Colocasia esculenta]